MHLRKILGVMLLLLICILPCFATAELVLELGDERIVVGEWLQTFIRGRQDETLAYSMYRGDEVLFEGTPVTAEEGWYQPDKEGQYLLRVTAADAEGNETQLEKAFEVCALPKCSVKCEGDNFVQGETVTVTAEVTGGTGNFTYEYAVIFGNECVDRAVTQESTWSYTPVQAGSMTVRMTVQDGESHRAFSECTVEIAPGETLSVSGNTGAFYAAGGVREYTVSSAGVWEAYTDADFITLMQHCGLKGDVLTLSVGENTGASEREGVVTVRCGDEEMTLEIFQSNTYPMETEAYMEPVRDVVFIDGKTLNTWPFASGEKVFSVEASGDWQVSCEADFVTLEAADNTLRVSLSDHDGGENREAAVILTCGRAQAVLQIFQTESRYGAEVKSVRLTGDKGIAHQDAVQAMVITTADAAQLTVSSDMWKSDKVFSADDAVLYRENELLWTVELPLAGEGEQLMLFTAEGETGVLTRGIGRVQVTAETPAFRDIAGKPLLVDDQNRISVTVNRAVKELKLEDRDGHVLAAYNEENAFVDRALTDDPEGRYARWTLEMPSEWQNARIVLDEQRISVVRPEEVKREFVLYGQQDTSWHGVKYRHSDLETSGCAIFALSHALQLMGYEGDEILPENLAKEYAFCLVEGGTLNSTLVGNAGKNLGFKTRYDLYENLGEIADKTRQGAMWSFMVAKGHIAAVVGISEDGKMFRIIDSAPSATFERMENASMYLQNEDGTFSPITDLAQVPGARFYLETNGYNGMEYWLEGSYVARQGVRLIMPDAAK